MVVLFDQRDVSSIGNDTGPGRVCLYGGWVDRLRKTKAIIAHNLMFIYSRKTRNGRWLVNPGGFSLFNKHPDDSGGAFIKREMEF